MSQSKSKPRDVLLGLFDGPISACLAECTGIIRGFGQNCVELRKPDFLEKLSSHDHEASNKRHSLPQEAHRGSQPIIQTLLREPAPLNEPLTEYARVVQVYALQSVGLSTSWHWAYSCSLHAWRVLKRGPHESLEVGISQD